MHADKANTPYSSALDGSVREISKEVAIEGFVRQTKLNHELLKGRVGCQPDGGLFFRDGYLEVAFEAKHQEDKGNAIERWFKNYWVLMQVYPQAKLITFCSGKGVLEGNGMHDLFKMVLKMEGKNPPAFNTIHHRGASFFISEYGFSGPAIKTIMEDALLNDGRSSGII